MLKETKGHLLINDSDISSLNKYGINCDEYASIEELIIKIENTLNNEELDEEEFEELDYIEETLQERNYYLNTNK